ncbi:MULTISPECIES: hypothetical protein [unclassified Rathayibacter]|uniref:hypothetical protein n=1 Tax=unclassified Rathayibacter TaxID=2609250 RepID=UPI0006FF0979|nr:MULTISPECIES: hypothetical protein [unclassified Rathayibacter]KQQ03668.1 hypothetical protein ASF42_09245 [Rathayibacter sp. Leaf294]KQS12124.1 hypothetical protein ASG06_09245 [Rathayibacter sp. Leaf185]
MGRTTSGPRLGAAAILLALTGGALAGCTSATPTPTAAPTTASATPTASTPPAADTPLPTATAAALTVCDQLLTPEEVASLTEDGLTLAAEATAFDFDYPIVQEIAADGVLCRWTGQGDVSVVVGQLAVDDDEWAERRTALLAEGFVADDASAAGFLNGPDGTDDSYPGRGVVHEDDVLYYVSYPGILASIEPLAD